MLTFHVSMRINDDFRILNAYEKAGILNSDFNREVKKLNKNAALIPLIIQVENKLKRIFNVHPSTLSLSVK
jgi:hypothetical protein